ncbi:MAG: FHA domain-containing protein [Planctomycetaceae bacterium]|nr:FHA domain-containing protein [Planctomycetaceae bacterium]
MPSLFVIQGRDQGKRFELQGSCVRVGREKGNTVQLHDTEVSRFHAELREQGGRYELVDLGSSNGTYVNSQLIDHHLLNSGDRVQVGRTLMIFTAGDELTSHERVDSISIVGQEQHPGGSRIVSTLGQQPGERIFGIHSERSESDSPWLARARSNLDVMYHTALAASHTLDIDQLLQRIMELIFEWVEADRGCVMLLDRDLDQLVPKVRRDRKSTAGESIEISRTILDYVLQHNEGVLTSDASDDERWDSAASIVRMGIREAICVPMQGRYGVVGVIYIDTYTAPGRFIQRPANRFSAEHLKLMVAIGHQAALAIEDTSYYSAMVQAERLAAIGQTIATLSHHIKNILQGIRGGSYLIEEGLKSGEFDVVSKGWAIVDKNQDKISNLVMDMLTFSKEREPEMVPADLNEVVTDVIELAQTRAADAGVKLVWTPDAQMPLLTFDPDALHRAVLNIVTNAVDACEKAESGLVEPRQVEPRQVTVRTEYAAAQQLVRIIVEDNGEGIAPEDLARIFSVFESRKGSRGTGLGLPVSQKIMHEHEGDIVVDSTPGQGSRFCMSMPAILAQPADPDAAPGAAQTRYGL